MLEIMPERRPASYEVFDAAQQHQAGGERWTWSNTIRGRVDAMACAGWIPA
ncbi:hypothetical protein PE067_20310 [Paracoccus sp. DMF-8]|uniref:hypothetical protein n=1 Tax=Paracoccus sp. DMF-8 TaxID=3019445 RepID=UPI0023E3FEEC|nr:hypothetical protein [Paracoccus sp. DMF-8]MDF3608280.1 hypothetical protein [Paracoccus sp. DMF-8]